MTLTQDLIYAVRSLRKAPGLVAVVVATLALGVGVNTTAFNLLSNALLASIGALGLLLAMIGLYGVLAWEVSRRTAEIGIRMALGASEGRVRLLVLRHTLLVVGAGIAAGMGSATLATLPLWAFLAGVSTTDPLAMGSVAALLAVLSLAASWYPVRRAARIDPIAALRYE